MSPKTEGLAYARKVLDIESRAIAQLKARVGTEFGLALRMLDECKGRVVTTGIGKPGFIAQKLSATLASTGVPSLYLHPAEAAHGDLGRVAKDDVVVALSNSGMTEELVRLVPSLKRLGAKLVVITSDEKSALARAADVALTIGALDEACPMGLVPTASSAALHAMCDALAMTLAHVRAFSPEQYARLHPGGTLGKSAMRVGELMRKGLANPLVRDTARLADAMLVMTNTPGRPGATNVVGKKGELLGIFTDGDLRRLAEKKKLDLKRPIAQVMSKKPRCVRPEDLALHAASIMRESKIDQLPVVDGDGKSVGLLDVQDLLAARLV
jgi:arabinose-5-phosphate isomerase